jgi:hypothetical protein
VEFDFTFEGWYDGDKKWDFETDTLQKTTNLVSKYTESKRKYTVSFHVTGREDITIDSVQVEYGGNCELTRLFDEALTDGFLYSVTVNGVEKATVKVLSDITVEVVFTKAPALEEPAKTEGGCGGSIGGVSAVLVGVAAMCLTVFKKKEEN